MSENLVKEKKFNGLKITTVILQVLIVAFIVLLLASVDTSKENWKLGYVILYSIVISYGVIALAIPLIISLVGLIMSIIAYRKEECKLGTLVFFIIVTITPIAIYWLTVLIGAQIPNWIA